MLQHSQRTEDEIGGQMETMRSCNESNLEPSKNILQMPRCANGHPSPPTSYIQKSRTLPPQKVISDLIDATCYDLIHLGGKDQQSIASVECYLDLLRRLDYYTDLNPKDYVPEQEDLRFRLSMALVVIKLCARHPYSCKKSQQNDNLQRPLPDNLESSELDPLINRPADEWTSLLHDLVSLRDQLNNSTDEKYCDKGLLKFWFQSVMCQVKALRALASLRRKLQKILLQLEEQPDKRSHMLFSCDYDCAVEGYKKSTLEIIGQLEDSCLENVREFIIPKRMLPSFDEKKDVLSVEDFFVSVTANINGLVAKEVFPLHKVQLTVLKLLRSLDQHYLSTPTLFALSYFGACRVPEIKAQATTPVSPFAMPERVTGVKEGRRSSENAHRNSKKDGYYESNGLNQIIQGHSSQVRRKLIHEETLNIARRTTPEKDTFDCASPSNSRGEVNSHRGQHVNRTERASIASGQGLDDYDSGLIEEQPQTPGQMVEMKLKALRGLDESKSHSNALSNNDDKRFDYCSADECISNNDFPDSAIHIASRTYRKPSAKNKRQKRKRYTAEEKQCLLNGVRTFGVGNWKQILENNRDVFKKNNRTNVNLKDLYRTMEMNGEN